jgi:hypothetical protein
MPELEPPMQYITLRRASDLSGVSAATLGNQARSGRLQTILLGNTLVTTRVWLHEYLKARETRQGRRKPLPADYVAPE